MKKFLSIILILALTILIFAGCGGKTKSSKETLTVGLIQLVEHPSLDEIREAFTAELEEKAKAEGLEIEIQYKNAQADMSLINNICRTFVDQKVDVIVAIATPTAQGAASVTKDIPIVFSAVSDPIDAGLVTDLNAPGGNITGVSDAINVEAIFKLAEELTPEVETFGLIYNKGEANSLAVINNTKAYLDSIGKSYVEKSVTTSGEVQQVSRALLEECDGIFVPIDNTVASAMTVLSNEAIKMKKPVYAAADSLVNDGGLATVGINYTQLGEETAHMTLQVLKGESVGSIPVKIMDEGRPVVNEETAKAIGVDVSDYS